MFRIMCLYMNSYGLVFALALIIRGLAQKTISLIQFLYIRIIDSINYISRAQAAFIISFTAIAMAVQLVFVAKDRIKSTNAASQMDLPVSMKDQIDDTYFGKDARISGASILKYFILRFFFPEASVKVPHE